MYDLYGLRMASVTVAKWMSQVCPVLVRTLGGSSADSTSISCKPYRSFWCFVFYDFCDCAPLCLKYLGSIQTFVHVPLEMNPGM